MCRSFRGIILMVLLTACATAMAAPQALQAAGPVGSAVSMGVAGAHAVDLEGLHAVTWNPAAMGLNRQTIQIGVTPAALRMVTSEGLSAPLIRFFLGAVSDAETAQLLETMSGDALGVAFQSRHVLQVALGKRLGLSASANAFVDGSLARDVIDLVANGPTVGHNYELGGTYLNWAGYFDVGAATAVPVFSNQFHVGIAGRRLFGWGYGEARIVTDAWVPGDPELAVIEVLSADEGHGFAYDMGLVWRLTPHTTADLSWLNVGSVTWTDPVLTTYAYDGDAAGGSTLETLTQVPHDPVHWKTPQTIRLGLGIEANPSVRWALEVARDLGPSTSSDTRISVGAESRRIGILPLRFGIKYAVGGGDFVFAAGFGLHLGPLAVDVAVPNVSALLRGEREAGIAMSTGLRF